jgi:hypothetical protein
MALMRSRLILAAAIAVPATALAAAQPSALAKVSGGLWELRGVPGASGPLRQCVADVLALAQFEHRGRNCKRRVTSEAPSSTVIDYTCGGAGFGHSDVSVITPRSLRIATQGISEQLPFNYVIQAHRLGDCTKTPASSRH